MPEGSYAFPVGSIRCTVLSDGYFTYPAGWFFSNVEPLRLRQALAGWRLPQEVVLSPYTCLLIETGRNVVLCDTGAGAASPTTGCLIARLDVAGIRPQDVDTVILSHAHPDHCGGAITSTGRPTFPNARYVLSEIEWEFWTGYHTDLRSMDIPEEHRRALKQEARQSLQGIRHHVELLDGEREIVPGVTAIPAPGHTPGHLALTIASGADRLLDLCDAALHPIHLEHPDWHSALDTAPLAAVTTRRRLLEMAVAENMRVMGFHFPFPGVGRVEATADGGWRWTPGW